MSHDFRLDEGLRRELAPGERVQWTGQPSSGAVFLDQLWAIIFSIIWSGIAAALLTTPETSNDTVSFLIASAMLALGIYMAGDAVLEWLAAGSTFYAITDKRLIITRRGATSPIQSLRLANLRGAERMSSGSRSTIRIPMGLVGDGDGGERMEYLKLYGVTEPERVFRLLTT